MIDDVEVCLVTLYYYPVLSGATERFRRYALKLLARGIRLHVMTIQHGDAPLHEIIDGIEIERFPLESSVKDPSAALLHHVIEKWKTTSHYPDILQIISHSIQGTTQVWRARWMGIPCLNTITMSPVNVTTSVARIKIMIYQWIKNLPFNNLIASSSVVAENLAGQGLSRNRIEIIPNGVDLQRFKPCVSSEQRKRIRFELGFSEDDEILLFVGFISSRKGVDMLLQAWPKIVAQRPKACLLLVGPRRSYPIGYKDIDPAEKLFTEKLNVLLADAPKPERIKFTGEVENIEDYLRVADVFLLPSKLEGFANVVPEAMASGLPCILTPYQGLPDEFGTPGQEYMVTSYNLEEFAATVVDLLENQDMRKLMGKSARNWVEKNLDVEMSIDSFAKLYRQLSSNKRKNR